MERMDKAEEEIEKLKLSSGGPSVGNSSYNFHTDLSAYVKQSDFEISVKNQMAKIDELNKKKVD